MLVSTDKKCTEAEYTSIRLAELVIGESASRFDFASHCDMHYYIFQDIYHCAWEKASVEEVTKL